VGIGNCKDEFLLVECNDVRLTPHTPLFEELDLSKWSSGNESSPLSKLEHSSHYTSRIYAAIDAAGEGPQRHSNNEPASFLA
jgi:hypothetical protein